MMLLKNVLLAHNGNLLWISTPVIARLLKQIANLVHEHAAKDNTLTLGAKLSNTMAVNVVVVVKQISTF